MFFFRDQLSDFEPLSDYVPMTRFLDYKYQLSLDGTVAAYRLPYLLSGDALVLKQTCSYYEHFYRDLVPYQHFLPLKNDLSDVIEQIQWARDHDDEVQRIVRQAQEFTQRNLLPHQILCYHVRVLDEYAKRLISPVEVHSGMEEVQHGIDESHIGKDDCDCHRSQVGHELAVIEPVDSFVLGAASRRSLISVFLPLTN